MASPLFKISGLDEALKKLSATSPKQQRQAYRAAARTAMLPVKNTVKASARQFDNPQTGKSVAKNVALRSMNRKKIRAAGGSRNDIGISVGILGGAKQSAASKENKRSGTAAKANPGGDTWYWRLVEFGRSGFSTKLNPRTGRKVSLFNPQTGSNFGTRVKSVSAKPFMRPALPKSRSEVIDRLAKRINYIINKAAS